MAQNCACTKAVCYSKKQNLLPTVVGSNEVTCVVGTGFTAAKNILRHYYDNCFVVYQLITILFS